MKVLYLSAAEVLNLCRSGGNKIKYSCNGNIYVAHISKFTFSQSDNLTHYQKSCEWSILNFIPVLPSGTGIKLGLIDYTFKIIRGAVTFGLIIIALKRKIEREFRP